jgi:hypothetical protein
LFEELTPKYFSNDRVQKFKNWIENAHTARTTNSLGATANQYDKAEELITFYTFAPLALRDNKQELIQQILNQCSINEPVQGDVKLAYEKLIEPPKEYLTWYSTKVNQHPVRYIREQSTIHNRDKLPLESASHIDFYIESNNLIILIEVKFTSDISDDTAYNPHRNQLARLVDVGIEVANSKGKKLVILLSTPSEFYDNKSRLYRYKIEEYANLLEIQRDIGWRNLPEIEKHLIGVKYTPLEHIISVLYTDFTHPDKEEALDFFKERNLIQTP